jgi:hypothetical protein
MDLTNNIDRAIYYAFFANAGGGLDPYQAVYDAMTNKPSSSKEALQRAFVTSLVSAGVWDELDGLWFLRQHSNAASEALLNWVSPGTFDATIVNSPTFTADEGFTTNGTNSYLNLNYNPTTDATNFTQNSGSIGFYTYTSSDNSGDWDMGAIDAVNGWSAIAARTGGTRYGRINCLSTLSDIETDGSGLRVAVRRANDELVNNINGVDEDVHSGIASAGVTNRDLYLGCLNNGSPGFHSARQYGLAFVGGSLTASQLGAIYTAFTTYITATTAASGSYMTDSEGTNVKDSEGNDIQIP